MRICSRIYYGYVIVAACFLIMTLAYGAQNTFGVFFKPMSGEFGWTRAETSGPFALYLAFSGVLTIISGRLSDRFGPRLVVSIGGLVFGAAYLAMASIHHLWQLYLYYGILLAAGTSVMYVPIVSLIARWFTKNRGAMSGVGIAGIGFGIAVVPAISSGLIEKLSWRTPFLIIGGFVTVAIALLAQLLRVDGSIRPESGPAAAHRPAGVTSTAGFTFRDAVRTRQFWMIFIAWILYGYFFQIGVVHIVPYATDLGMADVAAATVLTTIGLVGTAGRMILGVIGDHFGNRRTVFVSYGGIGLAFIGLALSHTVGMLYIFAVVFGFFFGVGILLIPLITEYYGFRELGIISGMIVFSNSFGGAIGPPVAGGIFDATGSYHWAFLSCALAGLAATLIVYWLRPPVKKHVLTVPGGETTISPGGAG